MKEILAQITKLDYEQIIRKVIDSLRNELRSTGLKGYFIGISGGLDSSVVLGLLAAAGKAETIALIIQASPRRTRTFKMRLP